MAKNNLTGVIWWPHSGGRWLCRSILKQHSQIHETAMVHPWIFNSSDMMMDLDITAQVHKARSLPELKPHLKLLKESTDWGRVEGLRHYFEGMSETYMDPKEDKNQILGEVCMGSPIPKDVDVESLYRAYPGFKTIHLVRNPVDSFRSFTTRHEMDDNAAKVAGSWLALNARLRRFFEVNPQFKAQYLLVRYEDLLQNAEVEIRKICDFMDLPFEGSMLDALDLRWGKKTKASISDQDRETIEGIAKTELEHYNYL